VVELMELGQIGGTEKGGVMPHRADRSRQDRARPVRALGEGAGCTIRSISSGNIFARREGAIRARRQS